MPLARRNDGGVETTLTWRLPIAKLGLGVEYLSVQGPFAETCTTTGTDLPGLTVTVRE